MYPCEMICNATCGCRRTYAPWQLTSLSSGVRAVSSGEKVIFTFRLCEHEHPIKHRDPRINEHAAYMSSTECETDVTPRVSGVSPRDTDSRTARCGAWSAKHQTRKDRTYTHASESSRPLHQVSNKRARVNQQRMHTFCAESPRTRNDAGMHSCYMG